MKQPVKPVLLAAFGVAFIALFVLAVAGYNLLTAHYNAPELNHTEKTAKPAVDFTAADMDGQNIALSGYFGKPIIVNFWATWCGPCKSELPTFDNAYAQYGEDIEFMMVNLTDGYRDTVTSVKQFITENGYQFPVYFDTKSQGADAYNVYSVPLTVFIRGDGTIYKTHTGAMRETTLQKYIDALLGGA